MSWSLPRRLRRTRFAHTGRMFQGHWQDLLVGTAYTCPGRPAGDGLDRNMGFCWLHLILDGAASLRTRSGSRQLQPGDFAFMQPNDPSGVPQATVDETVMAVWRISADCHAAGEVLGLWPPDVRVGQIILDRPSCDRLEHLIHMLHAHADGNGEWPLPAMLEWARRLFQAHAQPAQQAQEPDWLSQARRLLEQQIPVIEVARRLGLSYDHFRRCFSTRTGMPPRAYALRHRIEQAGRLLLDGRTPQQVAQQLGFCDASQFGKQFRAHTGCTPRQWCRGLQG